MNDYERCTEFHYGDRTDRPDIHGILIPGRRGRLLSVLYTAGGAGPHPAVLLLHGIPGCERNLDLAHALRRAGFHVMTFHYSGSWGSDGDYSLKNDLEDAGTVLDYLLADETYGVDKTRIYAVGHSMGGFVCGQMTAQRKEIRGGALLMPCDIGRLPLIARENPRAYEAARKILDESTQWLTGTTGEKLFCEIEENSENFRLENAADRLAEKPLLCVAGTLDFCTPPAWHCAPLGRAIEAAGGRSFQTVSFQTDHFFSDYRLAVAERVVQYLNIN